ncbi:MAG: hypothetical protein GF329_04740 [Candidatus Lokiarchaeota archaeon]|nr:hypothetical protein [Candidatus Lokiarchaeota archaeon]
MNIKNETEIIKKSFGIFIITEFYQQHRSDQVPLDHSFYYTINNNLKSPNFIIDFKTKRIKRKDSIEDLRNEEEKKYKDIIKSIIEKVKEIKGIDSYEIISFCRSSLDYFYIDHLLLTEKSKIILLNVIHLAQFANLDYNPDIKPYIKFQNKMLHNYIHNKGFKLENIHFSKLYGKSTKIAIFCISIGIFIIFASLIGLINIWSIFFGIFAILTGILWLFPIK